jgi:hypothetical protein
MFWSLEGTQINHSSEFIKVWFLHQRPPAGSALLAYWSRVIYTGVELAWVLVESNFLQFRKKTFTNIPSQIWGPTKMVYFIFGYFSTKLGTSVVRDN